MHVEQPQLVLGQLPLIEDTHDVRMLELSQRLRLQAAIARDLQRHEPLHGSLAGAKHGGKRPLAQRRQEIEIVDLLSGCEGGHALGRNQHRRLRGRVDLKQPLQLIGAGRKALAIVGNRHLVAVLPADVIFLVDQIAGQSAIDRQLGKLGQVLLDQLGRPTTLPAVFEIDLDQLDQRQAAQGRGLGRHEIGRGRRFTTFFPGGDKGVDSLGQLFPGDRNIVVKADRLRHSVRSPVMLLGGSEQPPASSSHVEGPVGFEPPVASIPCDSRATHGVLVVVP